MNRVQLVQVIIIIAAVMLGYQTVDSFAFFIAHGVSNLTSTANTSVNYTVNNGILSLLYAIGMFLIINNAGKLSNWIVDKVQPDETIRLHFSDKSVLYAVLLFLTIGTFLRSVPEIAYQLFEIIKSTVKGAPFYASYVTDPFGQLNWPQCIEAILAFILLIKVKPVVNYFHSKINPEDPHAIESKEDTNP